MKCLKCGADTPPNLTSSLCPACLEAQESQKTKGCLYTFLIVILLVIASGWILYFLWKNLSYLQLVLSFLACSIALGIWEGIRRSKMNPAERSRFTCGYINGIIVCVHCQTKGRVRTKIIEKDAGIPGNKASIAALTGGISILATGLSRKERVTQAHCDNCGSTWTY
jgi:hypothetical protein